MLGSLSLLTSVYVIHEDIKGHLQPLMFLSEKAATVYTVDVLKYDTTVRNKASQLGMSAFMYEDIEAINRFWGWMEQPR